MAEKGDGRGDIPGKVDDRGDGARDSLGKFAEIGDIPTPLSRLRQSILKILKA